MATDEQLTNLPVIIETAEPKDIDTIILVEETTWIATYPNSDAGITKQDVRDRFDTKFKAQRRTEIEKEMQNSNHRYRLIKKDSQVIGYTHGLMMEKCNDFVEIYILPDFQGKGIGGQAINDMLEWFGYDKPIQLEVATYNVRAIKVYTHYRFQLVPDRQQTSDEVWNILPSGQKIPVQFMEKPATNQ